MQQYRVGLICNDSRVLPELANHLKEPWSTITEEEGIYYWSSSHFEALPTVTEVDGYASRLLPRLNGLVKLLLKNSEELAKAGRIKFVDDQGRVLTQVSLSTSARAAFKIHEDENSQLEAKRLWLNIAEKSLEESEGSTVDQALSYLGKETNWDNLYGVYETIKEDYMRSNGIKKGQRVILPDDWIKDATTGGKREKDFTESANNFYISRQGARHPLATSHKANPIAGSPYWKVTEAPNKEFDILPMTLNEAKTFINNLIKQWLATKL